MIEALWLAKCGGVLYVGERGTAASIIKVNGGYAYTVPVPDLSSNIPRHTVEGVFPELEDVVDIVEVILKKVYKDTIVKKIVGKSGNTK